MIPQPGARTVSVSDAAKAVGVTRRTIYAWMDRGLLAYTYTAGGTRRILWDSLWRDAKGHAFSGGDEGGSHHHALPTPHGAAD